MAASAAILLCGVQTAWAEVCDKVYDFAYGDLASVNAFTELLLLAAGPRGGLIVFVVGLFVMTRKSGILFGLAAFLGLMGLLDSLIPRDEVMMFMIQEGCAPAHSIAGSVFLAAAALSTVYATVATRRNKPVTT